MPKKRFLLLASLFLSSIACGNNCWAQDFTIISLPDTQNEAQFFPQVMASQMKWIVANRGALNIQFVLGEGDIVNNGASTAQMQNGDAAYRVLDSAGIPYVVAICNHDYNGANPKASRNVAGFNQWFGPGRFRGRAYYKGNFPSGSNENSYGVVSISGKPYLFMTLEFMPRSAQVAWAESVLSANADKEAIIVTHSFMNVDNARVDRCSADMPSGNLSGDDLWAKLRKHANVIMVLSGHLTSGQVSRRSDIADNGNLVNQIFTNYQTAPAGGNGWLRIITFHPSSNTITVKTYSPWLNQFKTDSSNQYTVFYHNPHLHSGKGTLTGKVRSASCAIIAGAKVTAGGVSTMTGSDGRFSLALPPGSYTITVSRSGWFTSTKMDHVADSFKTEMRFYLTK